MILIEVRHVPGVDREVLDLFRYHLPKLAVGVLACEEPEAQVEAGDCKFNRLQLGPHDSIGGDIEVAIKANPYPSRMATKDQRTNDLIRALKAAMPLLLSRYRWSVILMFAPIHFGTVPRAEPPLSA